VYHAQGQSIPLPSSGEYFRPVYQVPQQYINDHCLIYAKGTWHLFFIKGVITGSWGYPGNEVEIGHATSPNLLTWESQPDALRIGPPGSPDAAHIYAPSVIERHGTYYMFYTGNAKSFDSGEHIFLATSTDLLSWTRYSTDPVITPDTSWAAYYSDNNPDSASGPMSCRDPHVIRDNTGTYGYICYYVADMKADSSRQREERQFSCIAAATSPDLIHWTDHGPVLIRSTKDYDEYTWAHPESPCVVYRAEDDRYYLFWKGGSGTRYVISSNPLDFENRNDYMVATSHASEIFEWNGEWFITSCSREVDDYTHGRTDRTKGLFLASITWNGRHPVVTSLQDSALKVIQPLHTPQPPLERGLKDENH
jgi:sucrose-6-phosphate hydrolase SacC (GH32 family)